MNERINGSSVYVWLADIDKEWPFHDLLSLCLSEEEIMRAGRFVFEKDKKRFIVSHGVLRRIISGLTGIVPEGIRFSVKEKGKPVVDNAGAGDLRFNISHSGRYVIYAFTIGREVGVDIERIRDFPDAERIVRRFFSEKEIAEYSRLPEDIKKKAFFTCWTRKEAFIKAIGMGFYMPLKSFSVSPDPFIKSDVEIHDGPGGRQWFFDDIESEDRDYTACAVTEASGGSISLIFRLYDRQKVL